MVVDKDRTLEALLRTKKGAQVDVENLKQTVLSASTNLRKKLEQLTEENLQLKHTFVE